MWSDVVIGYDPGGKAAHGWLRWSWSRRGRAAYQPARNRHGRGHRFRGADRRCSCARRGPPARPAGARRIVDCGPWRTAWRRLIIYAAGWSSAAWRSYLPSRKTGQTLRGHAGSANGGCKAWEGRPGGKFRRCGPGAGWRRPASCALRTVKTTSGMMVSGEKSVGS
jgi:hypothetical protein